MNKVNIKRLINKPVTSVFSLVVGYFIWFQMSSYAPAFRTTEVPIYIDATQDVLIEPAMAKVTFQGSRKALRFLLHFKPSIQIPEQYAKLEQVELDTSMVVCHDAFLPVMIAPDKIKLSLIENNHETNKS